MVPYIRDPAEISRRSFEIIAAEIDPRALPADPVDPKAVKDVRGATSGR